MKKLLIRLLSAAVALVLLAGAGAFAYVRTHDGPLGATPGGPFRSGQLTPSPDDWSFLEGRQLMEFQTMSPNTSREVWLAVHEGRLFVICGGMQEDRGLRNKRWPYYIQEDDRVILRIDDRLYEQRLQRIEEGPDILPVLDIFGRKYRGQPAQDTSEVSSGATWMYEVLPRRSA